jgi:hypothetical protein
VGQHRTLPPDQPDPPRPHDHARRVDDASDVDQSPTAPPAPAPPQRLRYRGIPLDGTPERLHRAVDLLDADTVGYLYYAKYYAKVLASRQHQREQAPLGRRLREPLAAGHQGVER